MRADQSFHKRTGNKEPWQVEDLDPYVSGSTIWLNFSFETDITDNIRFTLFFDTKSEQMLFLHQLRHKVNEAIAKLAKGGA